MKRAAGVLVVAGALFSGCSPVVVSGDFGGRALDIGGTAAAWLDETAYVADAGGDTPVLKDRATDAVVLHLMFSQAVFDPRVDLRTLSAADRQAILDDIARGDELLVDVSRGNVIREGDKNITLVKSDGSLPPEVLPFISDVTIHLRSPVISEADRYPDRVAQVASDRTARLVVEQTSPELSATLEIGAKKSDNENKGFLEGNIKVQFTLELLPERLAECNFARGDAGVVDACDLE